MEITIDNHKISETSRLFIIAEVGVNYYDIASKLNICPLDAAKLMIKEAAKVGADAVKFQSYKAGALASKFSPAYWDTSKEKTKSQYELFKKFDKFGKEEYTALAEYAKQQGIIFMSTPFDKDSADYLDDLMPVYKIASSDITNIPFIEHIAKKQKPIFLSTGASNLNEIEDAISTIERNGNNSIVLLHCVLNYPTKYEDANLIRLYLLKERFPKYILGYSDHTVPDEDMAVLTTAFLLGARVIEKHFTLDKSLPGNDHYHAMDPDDLKKFIRKYGFLVKILGSRKKEFSETEDPARKFARRSLVAGANIPRGAAITEKMLDIKRPGTGLSPKLIKEVIGKKAKRDIKEDEILASSDIEW